MDATVSSNITNNQFNFDDTKVELTMYVSNTDTINTYEVAKYTVQQRKSGTDKFDTVVQEEFDPGSQVLETKFSGFNTLLLGENLDEANIYQYQLSTEIIRPLSKLGI